MTSRRSTRTFEVADQRKPAPKARPASENGADAIARVAKEVLPALIARLASSELGELEVSQAGWRVRLRREPREPAAAAPEAGRSHGSHAGSGGGMHGSSSTSSASHAASGTGSSPARTNPSRGAVVRRAAVSPAVGYFTPRDGLAAGQAIRSGDVLGVIDVLGVTQPVVAPGDGVVGRLLATTGEAVEYGQELVRIDGIERLGES